MRSAPNADASASPPPFPFFSPDSTDRWRHRYFTKGLFRSRPAFSAIPRFGIYPRLPDAARARAFLQRPGLIISRVARGGGGEGRARVTRDLWRVREREYTARTVIMNIPFQRYRQDNLSGIRNRPRELRRRDASDVYAE